MAAAKPTIAILMAIYEPRLDWLRQQLDSLNAQTYPSLRLYIRDDCSPTVPLDHIRALVEGCVTAFPWTLERNETNLGSNATFERLTREAQGEYFAYCDQDDVWMPEKLTRLEAALPPGRAMSYCDMAVIDAGGSVIAGSLRQIRPRLRYLAGPEQAENYFFRNCTAGCSMLIRSDVARGALPFPQKTLHDHWLAIVGAASGETVFVDQPLVRYRQHSANQTGILSGVTDKASYRALRIEPLAERLERYRQYADPSPEMTAFISARLEGRVLHIWTHRALSPHEAKAEIAMKLLPGVLFQKCLEKVK